MFISLSRKSPYETKSQWVSINAIKYASHYWFKTNEIFILNDDDTVYYSTLSGNFFEKAERLEFTSQKEFLKFFKKEKLVVHLYKIVNRVLDAGYDSHIRQVLKGLIMVLKDIQNKTNNYQLLKRFEREYTEWIELPEILYYLERLLLINSDINTGELNITDRGLRLLKAPETKLEYVPLNILKKNKPLDGTCKICGKSINHHLHYCTTCNRSIRNI